MKKNVIDREIHAWLMGKDDLDDARTWRAHVSSYVASLLVACRTHRGRLHGDVPPVGHAGSGQGRNGGGQHRVGVREVSRKG